MNANQESLQKKLAQQLMIEQLENQLKNEQKEKEDKVASMLGSSVEVILDLEPGFAILLSGIIQSGVNKNMEISGILTKSAFDQLINISHTVLDKVAEKNSDFISTRNFFRHSTGSLLRPQNESFYKTIKPQSLISINIVGEITAFFSLAMLINETTQGDPSAAKMFTKKAMDVFSKIAKEIISQTISKIAPTDKIGPEKLSQMLISWLNMDSERTALANKEVIKNNMPPVKTGRNDPCPCGSGKKYKKCHGIL